MGEEDKYSSSVFRLPKSMHLGGGFQSEDQVRMSGPRAQQLGIDPVAYRAYILFARLFHAAVRESFGRI
jgi:hypothetical protein